MARLQDLTPEEARRFRTGRAGLDLAHTGGDGPYAKFELFFAPQDVSRWLGVIAELDGVEAGAADVTAARDLRRAIWNTAHRAIAGQNAAEPDREVINANAAHPAPVLTLTEGGTAEFQRPVTARHVLAMLARDAVDLFASPLAARIRVCSAPDCGLLYVDQSRTGNRQWCSMQRCGTRAKVRAHRERLQSPPEADL